MVESNRALSTLDFPLLCQYRPSRLTGGRVYRGLAPDVMDNPGGEKKYQFSTLFGGVLPGESAAQSRDVTQQRNLAMRGGPSFLHESAHDDRRSVPDAHNR